MNAVNKNKIWVYISGPVAGTDDYEERFQKAEEKLKENTRYSRVVNPVNECKFFPKDTPWEDYMKKCINLLTKANKIYMIKGWENSGGATEELRIARLLNLEVEFEEGAKDDTDWEIYDLMFPDEKEMGEA